MSKRFTKISLAILALSNIAFLNAQTVIPDVVVVAKPIVEEVRLDDRSSISSVVGEDQLRDLNAADLASALRRTPGVSISRYNAIGAYGGDQGGAVFIRGMGTSRPGSEIKTYVDGVPFYMPVWNHPLLDMLPINGMSSVTVYKSPQPHINGNNFASINLETKQATEVGVKGNVRTSVGTYKTVMEQADITGKTETLNYTLAQGHSRSSGQRANSDGQLNNAMGKITNKIDKNWSTGLSILAIDTKAGDPEDSPAHYNIRANSISAFVKHDHENTSGEFRIYQNSGYAQWLNYLTDYGRKYSQYDIDMNGVRWKENIKISNNLKLTAGLDRDSMSGKSTTLTDGSSTSMPTFTITSPYASVVHTAPLNSEWTLQSSATLRNYQHNYYDSSTSPAVGLSLIGSSVTYYMNLSQGMNYPGLDGPALKAVTGSTSDSWQNLKAEKNNHSEVGAKIKATDKTEFDFSYFSDRVNNRYYMSSSTMTMYSTGTFSNKGAEATLRHQFSNDWTAFVGGTFLNPSIYNLPYAPKQAYTFGLNGKTGPFKISLDAQNQSDFYDLNWNRTGGATSNTSGTTKLSGFTIANTRISYPTTSLGKRGEYFIAVENLFNTSYAYRTGYPMPGRWAQVGLSASF